MDDGRGGRQQVGTMGGVVGRDRRAGPRLLAAPVWEPVARAQAGVVARRQLLGLGLTEGQVGALLDNRRWRGLLPGVYATFTGPVPPLAQAWAACLACGDGAALGGRTALWLWGVLPEPPPRTTVCIPERRHITPPTGVTVVRRRRLGSAVHPVRSPPVLKVEEAVLDVADDGDARRAVDVVLRAVGERRTTPARLRAALAWRRRHRHRGLLVELLTESEEGVRSFLERRYRRDVELAHGLPRAERNRTEPVLNASGRAVRNRYRDVRYRGRRLVVELDGDEAHRPWRRPTDRARDNSVTLAEDRHLEYGWQEVVGEPCRVALEVATVLRQQGWRGFPSRCGPGCSLPP